MKGKIKILSSSNVYKLFMIHYLIKYHKKIKHENPIKLYY